MLRAVLPWDSYFFSAERAPAGTTGFPKMTGSGAVSWPDSPFRWWTGYRQPIMSIINPVCSWFYKQRYKQQDRQSQHNSQHKAMHLHVQFTLPDTPGSLFHRHAPFDGLCVVILPGWFQRVKPVCCHRSLQSVSNGAKCTIVQMK